MGSFRSLKTLFLVVSLTLFIPPVSSAQGTDPQIYSVYLPVVFRDFDPTWQFQSPIQVQLQPTPLSNPYLILDSSGRPHILWDTWPGENAFIYHTYLTSQGWSTPSPISQTLGRSKLLHPPVAGTHNDIYLVWYNELNFGGPFRILYDAWDGTKWGPEYELLGQGQSIYINGAVRLDRQGLPNVTYINTDGAFTTHIYYQKWIGTGFSTRQQITKPMYSSITWLDTNNGIRFYGDDYNNSVHYTYWENGSFSINDQTIPGKIGYRSTFLDGLNNLHLNRSSSVPVPGGNVTGIYHQCLKGDLSWTPEQVLTSQDHVLNYSLAFNNLLQPVIAWSKNNNQTIAVTFWNGCDLTKQKEISLPTIPATYGWGDFVAISENTLAGKVCLLSKEKYLTDTLWLMCTR